MTQWLGIENCVVAVTGSSSGIGRAIALEFAGCGCRVAVHANNSIEAGKKLVEEIGSTNARLFQADFASAHYEQFVDDIWNWNNRVDFWINNAGADVLTGDAAQWSLSDKLAHLQNVDVASTWFLSRAIGQKMKSNALANAPVTPCIINIGWDQAWQGMAGDSGELFSITKGSIMSLTKSLAHSLAPHVRVNCVAPGWIKTAWGDDTSQYWDDRAKSESLLNRWGTPQDIASAVVALCGRPGQFINGQVIAVNGGFNFNGEKTK
jgi:3-oxoacyl-[acyl-carrier protein] reductase